MGITLTGSIPLIHLIIVFLIRVTLILSQMNIDPDVNGLLCSLDSDEQFADDFFSFPAGLLPGDSPD
jgi:hypothetical protein